MPITLHHGLNIEKKQKTLFSEISKVQQNPPQYLVIVPNKNYIQPYKQELLSATDQSVLLGQTVMTWDDFILTLIKRNHHRVHVADQVLCHYLLFRIIQKQAPTFFRMTSEFQTRTQEVLDLIQNLKQCGFDSESAQKEFKTAILLESFFSIWHTYDQTLRDLHYFDQGELSLETLRLLKNNKLKLPNSNFHLFVSELYPLSPGQRQILRLLSNNFPDLNIQLFYDESFDQKHNILERAYEDLGNMARDQIHYESQPKSFTVFQTRTAYEEAQHIIQLIITDLKSGISPHQIAVVSLSPELQNILELLLRQKNIPCFNRSTLPISASLPSSKKSESNTQLWPETKDIIEENRKANNTFLKQKLIALTTLNDAENQLQFIENLLTDKLPPLNETEKAGYYSAVLESLQFEARPTREQIALIPLHLAGAYHHRKIYVVGFSLENLITSGESSLLDRAFLEKWDYHEFLKTSSFRLHVQMRQLDRLLQKANHFQLFCSKLDLGGRPTNLPPTDGMYEFKVQSIETNKNTVSAQNYKSSDFFRTKRHTFSISALQNYLKCPYIYYASNQLNLGSISKDEIEPTADKKGSFVHTVLQRIIQENESDYLEGMEYKSYRDRIKEKLKIVISEELENNEDLKEFNSTVVQNYSDRVYKTLCKLFDMEAENYKEKKKQTVPKYCEWPFGYDEKHCFTLDTQHGTIQLRGRIDRIDINRYHKTFSVIDYKTGNLPTIQSLLDGENMQLAIYLMVVQKLLYPNYQPSSALYYGLKENKIQGLVFKELCDDKLLKGKQSISMDDWDSVQAATIEKIDQALEGIYAGKFGPNPKSESDCDFCDYRVVCGKHTVKG